MIVSIIAIVLVYEFTIGKLIKKYSDKFNYISTKDGRKELVISLREEIQKGVKKERYLSKQDAQLLNQFIRKLPNDVFGINYDIGNSASLGFSHKQEIDLYGDIIFNVHVKDRPLHGSTVPLGEGNANFKEVFQSLFLADYKGDFILQTARAKQNNHLDVLLEYKNYTALCIDKYLQKRPPKNLND